MPATRAATAPTFDFSGFHFTGLTAPSRGASELCTWHLQIDAGAQSEPHQLSREEVFIVNEGTLTLVVAGEANELAAGDAFAVPPHTLFYVANTAATPARATVCLSVGVQITQPNGQTMPTPPWLQ